MFDDSILGEHERSRQALLAEGNRECIDCYCSIDAMTQERNDGSCNPCADECELAYWRERERIALADA